MTEGVTWSDLWAECTERLGSSDEARHIVEQASGRAGASWLITMDTPAPLHAVERVHTMLRRRLKGEPLQYVLGQWSFRTLDLYVDSRVLIPRPETEQVVEAALSLLRDVPSPKVVDLGTGSGAIALSIAVESQSADVWATDVSSEALEVAERNIASLSAEVVERIRLRNGSWFDALPSELKGAVDLVISNPPYVAERDRESVERVVLDWEPSGALFAGDDGLDSIRTILAGAPQWLNGSGSLILEMAPEQDEAVRALVIEAGFASARTGTDLAGRKRWVIASKVA